MAIRRQTYSPGQLHLFELLKASHVSMQMNDIPNIWDERLFPRNKIRELQFLCESVELPGKSLATTEYKVSGYNRAKIPILRNNTEINLTFLQDTKRFPIYEFFNTWIELAAPRDNVVQYYDDIVVREGIELIQWEEGRNEANFVVRLINAFPTSVATVASNWGDDNFQRINVSLTFEEFKVVDGQNKIKDYVAQLSRDIFDNNINNILDKEFKKQSKIIEKELKDQLLKDQLSLLR